MADTMTSRAIPGEQTTDSIGMASDAGVGTAMAGPRQIVPPVVFVGRGAKEAAGASGPRHIVPPANFEARGLAPTIGSPPSLQNHGGPVLGSVQVVPIYWGAAWATGTNAQLATQLDGFFDFIVTSSYMDLLHEYSTPSTQIGYGQRLASARVSNSEPGTVVGGVREITDAQVQTEVQGWIANNTVPATTANTLYFVFLPPNVVSLLGTSRSCQAFCGYHNHVGNVYYAVIPFADCGGCVFSGQFLDTLTEVSSHELAEAITDPALNAWWENGPGDEIGDICNRQTTRLGGYLIQTEWSNAQNACVIGPVSLGRIWGINADQQIYNWVGTRWTQIAGALVSIAVGSDGQVWGINNSQEIYQWNGTGWTQIAGALVSIAVNAGQTWGINDNQEIYRWNGASWTQIAGALVRIGVGSDGQIWGINASQEIYRWNGAGWTHIAGALVSIAVNGGEVWGINDSREIYRWNGSGWTHIAGALVSIAVGIGGEVWGINANQKIYQWNGTSWTHIAGALVTIAVGSGGEVWGINASQEIYQWSGSSWTHIAGALVTIAVG